LPPVKHVALIGSSGAGKTTLVNLLLRFWEYHQGSIQVGGHELRSYKQEDIRRFIAVISQNTYIFSATIRENLLISKPNATNDEIIQVSEQAQLLDHIQSLPNGWRYVDWRAWSLGAGGPATGSCRVKRIAVLIPMSR
jgi:ABC-type multidrug transport system fused ATPase/permease subunit